MSKFATKIQYWGLCGGLLNPLLMMLVYTVLFTILRPNNTIRDFHIFILVALIPWQFLSSTLMGGSVSITANFIPDQKSLFPPGLTADQHLIFQSGQLRPLLYHFDHFAVSV